MPTFALEIPPGIDTDNTTFSTTARWGDGDNVRFDSATGRPKSIDRIVQILASGSVPNNATGMFAYSVTNGNSFTPYVAIGTSSGLLLGSGTTIADISPVAGGGLRWSFASWGDILLSAPLNGPLFQYTGSGVATEVTQSPDVIAAMIVTNERQVLALGCNEEVSTTFNGLCIRGSDLEDYTDWTTTSANNAFEHILPGAGRIVAGKQVGTYVAVWTTDSLWMGQFIGDPGQTYRFDLVATGCGLVGKLATAVMGGVAYWMTPEHNFMRWVPGSPPEHLACTLNREIRENIIVTGTVAGGKQDNNAFAVTNSFHDEIWWFYRDQRAAASATSYVTFNVKLEAWSKGTLDRRCACEAGFLYDPGSTSVYGAWRPFLAIDGSGNVYSHDVEPASSGSGSAITVSWNIRSADQYIKDGRQRIEVQRVVPDFEQQTNDVDLTLYMRDRPQSTAVTKGPYTLTNTATKKDFRASGMIMAVKLSGTGQMRLGKPVFDLVPMGQR